MNNSYLPGAVWTYTDFFAVFVGGLLGSVFALTIGVALNGGNELEGVTLLAVSSAGQAITQVAMLGYMSRTRGTSSWDIDFGFRFQPSDWLGLLYGIGLQIAVIVLIQLPLFWLLNIEDPPVQDVAEIAGEASSPVARIVVFLVVVVVAPVTEELVYRGVLLSRLRRGLSPHVAVAVAAFVFSGIHLLDPDTIFIVPGLFVIGLVLGYQALHTGRIGLAITTHAGVNFLAAVALLAGLDV
ncbi:MAG: type II CAAX endopeptidase family protein [Acidimicrobiia bacterium]|nr:type II CAAX endopeptidase family protein [Acidimicrobiia bacterium]